MIVSIDQGSSATKVLVVDPQSAVVIGRGSAAVESLAGAAIIASVEEAVDQAVRAAGAKGPFEIGIANQRSTLAFFDADGRASGDVVPWWDRNGLSADIAGTEAAAAFRKITGLPLLPNWWAGKLARHLGQLRNRRPGTVDTLLIAWLTQGQRYVTDRSNAARTGLLDLRTGKRSPACLRLFGLPPRLQLARVVPSLGPIATITRRGPLRNSRIVAALGDAGASLLGATGGKARAMSLTLGTGGFLHMPAPVRRTPDGLYLAPTWDSFLAWEAAIPAMGSALDQGMKAASLPRRALDRMQPRRSRTLSAVLAPSGLGALAPPTAEGIHLFGPWASAPPEEKLGAILESLALLIARACARFPTRPESIVAGGGLAQSAFLLQRIADLTGVETAPLLSHDSTAWGAARAAARALKEDLPSLPLGEAHSSTSTLSTRRGRLREFERRLRRCEKIRF